MEKKITVAIDKLYHDMAVADLRLQNMDNTGAKLTYNSMLYLDIIYAHQGEYTASKIADMLHVARPSVTQKINELEKMGYITKKQSKVDKRVYYLYVDECNLPKEYTEMDIKVENEILKRFSERYSQEEINKFYDMLSIIGDVYLEEFE